MYSVLLFKIKLLQPKALSPSPTPSPLGEGWGEVGEGRGRGHILRRNKIRHYIVPITYDCRIDNLLN